MRRLLILAVVLPAFGWLLWAACESDDYRDTLPFRSFDASAREAGRPAADLSSPNKPDQGQADMPASDGGSGMDGGMVGDAGALDAGGVGG